MRQVREVPRLKTAGVGLNEIARRVGVAPSTVRLTLKRLASAGFDWPLPADLTDAALEAALFAAAGTKQGHRRRHSGQNRDRSGMIVEVLSACRAGDPLRIAHPGKGHSVSASHSVCYLW
jgi:IS30 family transposase